MSNQVYCEDIKCEDCTIFEKCKEDTINKIKDKLCNDFGITISTAYTIVESDPRTRDIIVSILLNENAIKQDSKRFLVLIHALNNIKNYKEFII